MAQETEYGEGDGEYREDAPRGDVPPAVKLQMAVQKIERDPNLRFLVRHFLSLCGVPATPIGSDPIETARLCGRHEMGMVLVSILAKDAPMLWPALILEDYNERKV